MLKKSRVLSILIFLFVLAALLTGLYFGKKFIKNPTESDSNRLNNDSVKVNITDSESITFKSNNSYDPPSYSFSSPYHLTLISISTVPGTQITEHVWGFRLKDQDYRFRTRSATCYIISDLPVGVGLDKLQIGLLYRPSFGGFEAQIAGTEYMQILSSEQNSSCKAVRENLRVDPEDKSRLINFFRSGSTNGFSVDESGIVDLTQVISAYGVESDNANN